MRHANGTIYFFGNNIQVLHIKGKIYKEKATYHSDEE